MKISELIHLVFSVIIFNYLWPCKQSPSSESISGCKEKPCISDVIIDTQTIPVPLLFSCGKTDTFFYSQNIRANMAFHMS